MHIRPSLAADLPAITAIYAHHVQHGTGTFELEPPDEAEMARRNAPEVLGPGEEGEDIVDGSIDDYLRLDPMRGNGMSGRRSPIAVSGDRGPAALPSTRDR